MREWLESVHWAWKVGTIVAAIVVAFWSTVPSARETVDDPHKEQIRILHDIDKTLSRIEGLLSK